MPPSLEDIIKKTRVSPEYIEREISDEHVRDFAKYCTSYEEIAPYLKLSDEIIDAIKDKSSVELRRRETLKRWKRKYSIEATYRVLLEALIQIDKASLANEICCTLQEEEGEIHETFCS